MILRFFQSTGADGHFVTGARLLMLTPTHSTQLMRVFPVEQPARYRLRQITNDAQVGLPLWASINDRLARGKWREVADYEQAVGIAVNECRIPIYAWQTHIVTLLEAHMEWQDRRM